MTKPHAPKSDRDVQRLVLAALNEDARLNQAEVGVEVSDGVVTLTGTVSRDEKVAVAGEIAMSLAEVRDVANDLIVEGETHERSDAKIAQAIRHALTWNTAIPADRIDTIIRRGVVTLRGIVDHRYQRKAAEETVAGVPGVVAVNDRIRVVTAPVSGAALREEIADALAHPTPAKASLSESPTGS